MTQLKEIRTQRGLSQEALAELVGVSRQTVSKWETGTVQPSAENLTRLSRAFQISVDAFLNDDWTPQELQAVEAMAVPAETPAETAGEVPLPRRRNYRLWFTLAAAIAAVGIIAGVVSFSGRVDDSAPAQEIVGEEVDGSLIIVSGSLQPLQP